MVAAQPPSSEEGHPMDQVLSQWEANGFTHPHWEDIPEIETSPSRGDTIYQHRRLEFELYAESVRRARSLFKDLEMAFSPSSNHGWWDTEVKMSKDDSYVSETIQMFRVAERLTRRIKTSPSSASINTHGDLRQCVFRDMTIGRISPSVDQFSIKKEILREKEYTEIPLLETEDCQVNFVPKFIGEMETEEYFLGHLHIYQRGQAPVGKVPHNMGKLQHQENLDVAKSWNIVAVKTSSLSPLHRLKLLRKHQMRTSSCPYQEVRWFWKGTDFCHPQRLQQRLDSQAWTLYPSPPSVVTNNRCCRLRLDKASPTRSFNGTPGGNCSNMDCVMKGKVICVEEDEKL